MWILKKGNRLKGFLGVKLSSDVINRNINRILYLSWWIDFFVKPSFPWVLSIHACRERRTLDNGKKYFDSYLEQISCLWAHTVLFCLNFCMACRSGWQKNTGRRKIKNNTELNLHYGIVIPSKVEVNFLSLASDSVGA